jgi:hypothetical protein
MGSWKEVVMALVWKHGTLAVMIGIGTLAADAALAAQGPGTGVGTASSVTQLAMANIVYGTSALVVGAGLIGALRKQ